MARRQAALWEKPVTPRRVLMHFDDAGEIGGESAANFVCRVCWHRAGWLVCTLTEMRRGVPCPKCNHA